MTIEFWVTGDPKGQPRPRAFARFGKARVFDPGTAEHWKGQIAQAFGEAPRATETGPVRLSLAFAFARPKGHYRKDGTLKPSAPVYHTSKPDVDNLAKAVMDALTTLRAWQDDDQVVTLTITKRYVATPAHTAGCLITINPES